MLRRHFAQEEYYTELMELFHDTTYRTEMGQLLDLTSQPMDGPSDLTRWIRRRSGAQGGSLSVWVGQVEETASPSLVDIRVPGLSSCVVWCLFPNRGGLD